MSVPGMDGVLQGLGQVAGSLADGVSAATSDFVNSSSGVTRQAVQGAGILTGTDPLGWARDRDVQQEGNRRRDDLYAERDAARYQGEYDASSVQMENFDGMSHEEIKARLDSAAPGGILEDGRMWRAAADRLQQSVSAFTGEIASAIGGGWEGAAADKASSGVSGYSTSASELQRSAILIANKIEEAHTGIDQARRRMPEPESTNVLDILRSGIVTNPIGGLQQAFHKSEEARQEAIQIMKTEYAPVVQQADSQVPVLPPPHNPVAVPPDVPPTGRPVDGGGSPGDGTAPWAPPAERAPVPDRADSASGGPGDGGGAGDREAGIDPSAIESGADGSPQGGATAGTPFAGDAVTRAASADASGGPGSAGFGTGGNGAGGSGSGGTGVGSGAGGGAGTGLGSGGGFASGPGALGGIGSGAGSGSGAGRAVSPGPGAGAVPAAGASGGGAGAVAGRPGAPGMGAMAPGGARGGGDEDTEHRTPGYLVSVQNGSELIGDLPKVAPPVLGG
ncbi:PPE domain-containing protein [Rhodococcus daqingensis]|uniref:PPE domain-containing protein n=1 Tax=Rhodococcus daqingensis TaxID=2479363 RepID=A0ABW2S5L1_9NOCA